MSTAAAPAQSAQPPVLTSAAQRVASVDAYRGVVMFLMMAEVLHFNAVSRALPDSGFWKFLAWQQSHVEWAGCTLHDMIQPSFTFLVGVALPYSIASRQARGQSMGGMTLHAVGRALILIFLGVFLRSIGRPQTNFTFEDTLSQIGLGYSFLFLLGFRPMRDQIIALVLLLVAYWAAFAMYPLPSDAFDYSKFGVPPEWLKEYGFSGFAAHWNKNSNFAWAVDLKFMNWFPREKPFVDNGGGYSTASFIPTLGTMILGLIAGGIFRSERTSASKLKWFVIVGVTTLATGWLLGFTGVCPVVKRIWTPSWTLFSGGICFLTLAALYAIVDLWQQRSWTFPFVVIGANSIAAYCIAETCWGFISSALRCHLGNGLFKMCGAPYEPFVMGVFMLLVLWLILFQMYRKKIFIRI